MRAIARPLLGGRRRGYSLAKVSVFRWLLVGLGFFVWVTGLYLLSSGSYPLGGGLVIAGGLCLVIAASGGWPQFVEGVTNWLFFWR